MVAGLGVGLLMARLSISLRLLGGWLWWLPGSLGRWLWWLPGSLGLLGGRLWWLSISLRLLGGRLWWLPGSLGLLGVRLGRLLWISLLGLWPLVRFGLPGRLPAGLIHIVR